MLASEQAASVEMSGFVRLVANIRDVERSLGGGIKRVRERAALPGASYVAC